MTPDEEKDRPGTAEKSGGKYGDYKKRLER